MKQKRKTGKIILWSFCGVFVAVLGFLLGMVLHRISAVRIVPIEGSPVLRSSQPDLPALFEVPATVTGEELSADEIYTLLAPACVGITTSTSSVNAFGQVTSGVVTGSGFLIRPDGYLLTNYHVVETAVRQELPVTVKLFDGREFTAELLGGDKLGDVALLKIPAEGLPYATLGDFETAAVGETVYAIGNPLGELTYTMTRGIVSAQERTITVESNVTLSVFQLDAAINSGNSGGPVVDCRGRVIGIASAKYAASGVEGIGFAVSINDAAAIAEDLLNYGYVRGRVMLGLSVANASYYGAETGAIVISVSENGCAALAGIQEGDIITEANGTPITGSSDLTALKKTWSPGDVIELTVLRDGSELTVRVTLTEYRS